MQETWPINLRKNQSVQTIQNDRDSDTSGKDFKIAVIIILKDLKENMKTIRWEMDDIRKKSKWNFQDLKSTISDHT